MRANCRKSACESVEQQRQEAQEGYGCSAQREDCGGDEALVHLALPHGVAGEEAGDLGGYVLDGVELGGGVQIAG
jgi:hypothetical protein